MAKKTTRTAKKKTVKAKNLIIVESPAKTRTLRGFVGSDYDIAASMGHVRDLPKKVLGVDIDNDFQPTYRLIKDREEVLGDLSKKAEKASSVYLASDPDREGEAIAWHVAEALKLKEPKRIEFNEITRAAVRRALKSPRTIDTKRVDAQQARRILDRLVGYRLSPFLWRRLGNMSLSAGRVQSVALKMVCDREREIQAFVAREYWNITATLAPEGEDEAFSARLAQRGGKKIAVETGQQALAALRELFGLEFRVSAFAAKEESRRPPPPFITSTLQQDASNRLGFGTRKTMVVAQQLYEGLNVGEEGHVGLITYMRTDSTRVANEARRAARDVITAQFGDRYVPATPWVYRSPRGAQEAHEAIRPTDVRRHPDSIEQYLTRDQARLYRLIWSRFLASQMAAALVEVTTVDIQAGEYLLRARGTRTVFEGFTAVYSTRREAQEQHIPALQQGQALRLLDLCQEQKFTEPPRRYTEASLVRALEAKGIGRPSTYAPIIATIIERRYVTRRQRHLHPTRLGFSVNDHLAEHFPDVINEQFTAAMEEKLDSVEQGGANWVDVLRDFYTPFEASVAKATEAACPECGRPLQIKEGRYGHFLACSGYPECQHTEPFFKDEPTEETCSECGKPMVIKSGRFGKFLACTGYPDCRNTRPLEKEPPRETDQSCDKCDKPMVVRTGPRGEFLGCSGYPDCKNTRPIDEREPGQTDEKCPQCGKELRVRRGKRGLFLGCSGYPECRYTAQYGTKVGRSRE